MLEKVRERKMSKKIRWKQYFKVKNWNPFFSSLIVKPLSFPSYPNKIRKKKSHILYNQVFHIYYQFHIFPGFKHSLKAHFDDPFYKVMYVLQISRMFVAQCVCAFVYMYY